MKQRALQICLTLVKRENLESPSISHAFEVEMKFTMEIFISCNFECFQLKLNVKKAAVMSIFIEIFPLPFEDNP